MLIKWQPSPNHAPREKEIKYVVLHYTEFATDLETIEKFMDPKAEVSSHYLVGYDGQITQFVRENMVAWHAGVSAWGNDEKLNQTSIGIEISNLGEPTCNPYTAVQYRALAWLLRGVMDRHNIIPENVLGHSDIAPDRKIDPGKHFNWRWLEDNGLAAPWTPQRIPASMSELEVLRQSGYRGEDKNIIAAFQRRHCPEVPELGLLCPRTAWVIRRGNRTKA